jgi:hypothetical protein
VAGGSRRWKVGSHRLVASVTTVDRIT